MLHLRCRRTAVFTVRVELELLSTKLCPCGRLQRAFASLLVCALMRRATSHTTAGLEGLSAIEARTLDRAHSSSPNHLMARGRVGTRDGSSLQAMNSAAEANPSAISGLSAAAVR